MPNKKTKSHNRRLHNRGGKNVFWLVLDYTNTPILFTRRPRRFEFGRWSAAHTTYYPKREVVDAFPKLNQFFPIKVKLSRIIDNTPPHFYIQRYKDCLFISSFTVTYYRGGDPKDKHTIVPHDFRLSNKLFPETTEESGIKGIKILPID